MAQSVSARYAQAHLPELLDQVIHGEEVVITKSGRAVARLVAAHLLPRVPGIDKGKLWIADDFDSMSASELAEWYDSGVSPK